MVAGELEVLTPSQHRKIANSINYFLLPLAWLGSWQIGIITSIALIWVELQNWSQGPRQLPQPKTSEEEDLAQRIEQAYATWEREEQQVQALNQLKKLLENPFFINAKGDECYRCLSGKTIVVKENRQHEQAEKSH